jgi:predicted transcriptional regulator
MKSTRLSDSLWEKLGRFAGLEHRSRVEIHQSLFHKANDLEIERERITAEIEAIYNLIDKYVD